MAYRKVLYTLQDVFPQIDLRILRAVASEYSSDVDAAVEFVLSDVLPVTNEPTEPHYTLHNDDKAELNDTNSGNDTSGSHFDSSCIENPVERCVELEENTNISAEPVMKSVLDIFAEHAVNAFKTCSSVELDSSLTCPEVSKEQTKSIAELLDHSAPSGQALNSYAPADMNSEPKTIRMSSDFSINIWEPSSSSTEVDPCTQETEEFHDLCSSEAYDNVLEASGIGGKSLLPSMENCANSIKCEAGEDASHDSSIGTHVQERSIHPNGIVGELWASTQSGQIPPIDCINGHISDMTKSKEALSSALESTIVKMKDVEIHEENARQAKEVAVVAGQDIRNIVEDYDRRIMSARESNEKQSVEVCKAKSLLVAESQELQLRLMNMSVQKDMYLSVIEEINQTLDAQLTAAMEEQAAAKQELAVKEQLAHQTVKEKEAVIAKIADESQRLQKEAEENNKLRELLLDRGRIVDVLQKEASAICLNIASLKERVNGNVASQKRLLPASSSIIYSASSDPRLLSEGPPSPLVMENPTVVGEELARSQTTEDTTDGHKASPDDDDWEIF